MKRSLDRSLGLTSVVALSISAMVGSGIFVLPGIAAAEAGPAVPLAYLFAALAALPAALSKSELATAMPASGGTYVFLDRSFGPMVGTIAGLALWVSLLLKSSFALVGFAAYLVVLTDVNPTYAALVALVAIVAINIMGVKKVGKVLVVFSSIMLVGLGVLIGFGISEFVPSHFDQPLANGAGGMLAASGLVFASYNGVTKVASVAEEVENPARNLPLGILISLFIVTVLYALVSAVLVGNIEVRDLATDLRPIHTLAEQLGGHWAGIAAGALGVMTLTSMANAGLLAASRYPLAMARGKSVPSIFGRIDERFVTPIWAILATGLAMGIAIVSLDVVKIAKLASACVLITFAGVNMAVVVFRESRVRWYQPAWRSPFYPWVQISGVVLALLLLSRLGFQGVLALVVSAAAGGLLYAGYGRKRTSRKGVIGLLSRRTDVIERRAAAPVVGEEYDPPTGTDLRAPAAVCVPLFGRERSPEILVELGGALADGERVAVVHLEEVPEQTALTAVDRAEPKVRSLARRVRAVRETRGIAATFESILCRDAPAGVDDYSESTGCEWVVMQWHGPNRQLLLPERPLGWLLDHLDANVALYQDAGVRYVREILVYPEPGPDDALVVHTADRLATAWNAKITLVRYVPDDAPEPIVLGEGEYLAQLAALCQAPHGFELTRGTKEVAAIGSLSASYDLLVMSRQRTGFWQHLMGTRHDRIASASACSVLTVQTPVAHTHRAVEHSGLVGDEPFQVGHYIDDRVVGCRVEAGRRDRLFQKIGEAFAGIEETVTAKELADGLLARERAQTTGAGHGVALPHASFASMTRSRLGLFTTKAALDFGSPSGDKSDVFFVMVGPPSDRQVHLLLLSSVARLVKETDLLDRARECEGDEELAAVLRDHCEAVDKMALERATDD